MRKIILPIIILLFLFSTANAERIDPDVKLHKFWEYSKVDQDESIDIFITQLYGLISESNGKFLDAYSLKSKDERISDMRACMVEHGIPNETVGQAYVLCVRKLKWLRGVE